MKNIKYLFICFLFFSCLKNKSSDGIINGNINTSFNSKIDLEVAKVFESVYIGNPGEMIVKDSLLFLLEIGQDKFIRCINIKNKKEVAFFLSKGSGPSEILYGLRLQFYMKDSIQVFGKAPSKLFTFSINDILNNKTETATINTIPDNIDIKPSGIMISDNFALFPAVNKSNESSKRYCKYNIQSKTFLFFGDYPKNSFQNIYKEPSRFQKAFVFQSTQHYNPETHLIASTTANFPGIEVIDSKKNKIIHSRFYDNPQFENENIENVSITMASSVQKVGFFSTCVTNKHIYCLYTGKTNGDKNYYFGRDIIVYNWDLTSAKRFFLDREILLFTISYDEKFLYAITSEGDNYILVRYDLSWR